MNKLKLFLSLIAFAALSSFVFLTNEECDSEFYDGEARDSAKISIAKAKYVKYASFDSFIQSLTDGATMYKLAVNESRCKEENRNVEITGWIYTYVREGDEDYHLILGSTSDPSTAEYFNIEVSGLPKNTKSKTYKTLLKARNQFKKIAGITECKKNKDYKDNKFGKPVKVKVKGSLFFDRPHFKSANKPGPAWAKPKTVWEIHPVTNMVKVK